MKEIGQILKENRLEQKKTIEDISSITKMNINIIKNIEEGNIDYFKNDLGYLRYYIRSYVSSLDIEIENLDEHLEDATLEYTQAITILEQEKLEQINEQVKHKKVTMNLSQGGLKSAKTVDWTLISLIVIVVFIAGFLVYSLFSNALKKPNTPEVPPTIVEKEEDKPEEKEEDKPEEVIEKESTTINMLSPDNIELVEWTEKTSIKVSFKRDTWVQMRVNGAIVLLPNETVNNKTYVNNDELLISDHYLLNGEEVKFKETDVITIRFGVMNTNEFYVNDKKLELDPEVANNQSAYDLNFTYGKKGNS